MKKPIPLSIVTKVSNTLAIVSILLLVISKWIAPNIAAVIFLITALLLIVANIIFMVLYYRCPHCGGFLRTPYRHHYCPHCGTYLI